MAKKTSFRTIKEYNQLLGKFNYRIEKFRTAPESIEQYFSIVKTTGTGNWFQKYFCADVEKLVFGSTDYKEISLKANDIIAEHASMEVAV